MTNSIKTISLREDVISCIKNHKEEIHSTFDVDSLAIFGSVAKGTANAQSDVDILVRYTMTPGLFKYLKLKKYLETLLGRPVDLVTEKALKKQLQEQILSEAINVT